MRVYHFAFRVVVGNDADESEVLERMRLFAGPYRGIRSTFRRFIGRPRSY